MRSERLQKRLYASSTGLGGQRVRPRRTEYCGQKRDDGGSKNGRTPNEFQSPRYSKGAARSSAMGELAVCAAKGRTETNKGAHKRENRKKCQFDEPGNMVISRCSSKASPRWRR